MIRTIIFDFGNVIGLFDYHLALQRLTEHTHLGAEELRSLYDGGALEDAYEAGRMSTPVFLQRLREIGQLRCGDDYLATAWADIFRPNQEVCDLLPVLKPRYRLLLGSNTNELHSRQFRRQFADHLRYFDALVLSHEIGCRKPSAGFWKHCQKLSHARPPECLFIDDLPANVAGAREHGWQGIVYTGIEDLRARMEELGVVLG